MNTAMLTYNPEIQRYEIFHNAMLIWSKSVFPSDYEITDIKVRYRLTQIWNCVGEIHAI